MIELLFSMSRLVLESLKFGTIIIEAKDGAYEPTKPEDVIIID